MKLYLILWILKTKRPDNCWTISNKNSHSVRHPQITNNADALGGHDLVTDGNEIISLVTLIDQRLAQKGIINSEH